MSPAIMTTQELLNGDDLNEKMLEDAAIESNDPLAPETIPETAAIIAWDETAGAAGDEAGQEQRQSALNRLTNDQH